MKILIIDHYYPEFLKSFEKSLGKDKKFSYEQLKEKLMAEMFGTADFYSKNLKNLGHDAEEVIINFDLLQRKWAKENNLFVGWNLFKKIPYIRGEFEKILIYKILEAQIKKAKPDIIYVQCIGFLDKDFVKKIKKYTKLIVGQIASPLPPFAQFEPYDLVISSLPNIVKKLNENNIKSEYLPLAFESSIADNLKEIEKKYECTFVGGISKNHSERYNLLEKISQKLDLHIFGYGKEEIDRNTKMYANHHGEVWGKEMYKVLSESRITINKHIDIAENFANNMRLFEATGMGALLITDNKSNLGDLFEISSEIVAYENEDDLIKKIDYFNKHKDEAEKIAKAGQERTLKEHSYLKRMKELSEILEKYFNSKIQK